MNGTDVLAGAWMDGIPLPTAAPAEPVIGLQRSSEIKTGTLAQAHHVLAVEVKKRPGVTSSPSRAMTAFMRIKLEDGRTLRITAGSNWLTSLVQAPNWFTPEYDDGAWERARELPGAISQPWPPTPAMHLRREFSVDKGVRRARLYATALGLYEARLNGKRVGDALLNPPSSHYSKRVLYQTYDVTDSIRNGTNVLGLTVGDGWYASGAFGGRYVWGPPQRRVRAQLEVTFEDGSRQILATGRHWQICQSPIVSSDVFDGEVYDARLEQQGWDDRYFDHAHWKAVEVAEEPPCRLTSQVSPPIRATQTLKPRILKVPRPGVYVFDFGQNFAGWCRLRVKGRCGTRVEMRFAETLLLSGEVDQSSLIAARQTDVFILKGSQTEEVFEPHFTYHGFRYVQITGLPSAPIADMIDGIVVHSDLDMTGLLKVDQELIDQIWRNIVWTQRSNFVGIPTDCPQRNERVAYLGDAGIFWDAASFNMDVAAFTRSQMVNASDGQGPYGTYALAAPLPIHREQLPTPAWSCGAIILAWTTWRRYGDLAVVEQNWEDMSSHLQFILRHNPDYLWRRSRSLPYYGDWYAVDEKYMFDPTTPHDLIATAFWAHAVDLLAQLAEAIGRDQDTASLRRTHTRIRSAFVDAFLQSDGRVGNDSQTSYVLALKFGLIPSKHRQRAADRLAVNISRRGGALSTGILGTQYLLDVLADWGYGNLAYDLLLRTEYPSWGYMIKQGGTTIWETWNGRAWAGDGSKTIENSYNHYALGAICGFLFRRVAGIDAAAPGFEAIVVRPVLDPRVRSVSAEYDSVMGRISTSWALALDGAFTLDITLPANTTARIHLPAGLNTRIEEGGEEIGRRPDIRGLGRFDRREIVDVGSGEYQFLVSLD